jgi:L-threonylcarbamoyladenylate synthase
MSRRWHIQERPTSLQLAEIAKLLRDGCVVMLPTDTIYGLHAVATDPVAVARIADIKGRDETKPFVVIAASIDQLTPLGVDAPPETLERLASVWPAPLTAILPLREPIPASRGAATVAIRIPALEWLRQLALQTGPLVSTSANRSGEEAVTHPSLLASDLQDRLDAIVDAGELGGAPSTIVDLTTDEPRLIRAGEVSFTQELWKTLRKTL